VDWGQVGEIAVAALATLAAGLKLMDSRQETSRRRSQLANDLDLLDRLPPGSEAHERLERFINKSVVELVVRETEERRDPVGIVLAGAFLIGAGWAGYQYWVQDGSRWWLVPAAVFGLIGLVGMSQDAVPRRRDARGRPIRKDDSSNVDDSR
jgi:hypothetical protein